MSLLSYIAYSGSMVAAQNLFLELMRSDIKLSPLNISQKHFFLRETLELCLQNKLKHVVQ